MTPRILTDSPLSTWQRHSYRGPPIDVLHGYARHGHVDRLAPITGRREMVIDVAPDRVWAAINDPANSVAHSPDRSEIQAIHGLTENAIITWHRGRHRVAARVVVAKPGHELAWTSSTGAPAIHRLWLHVMASGCTRLVVEASIAEPFRGVQRRNIRLAENLERMLETISAAAVATLTGPDMSPAEWLADSEEAVLEPARDPHDPAHQETLLNPSWGSE